MDEKLGGELCIHDHWVWPTDLVADLELLPDFIRCCQLDGLWFDNLFHDMNDDLIRRICLAIKSNSSLQSLVVNEIPRNTAVELAKSTINHPTMKVLNFGKCDGAQQTIPVLNLLPLLTVASLKILALDEEESVIGPMKTALEAAKKSNTSLGHFELEVDSYEGGYKTIDLPQDIRDFLRRDL